MKLFAFIDKICNYIEIKWSAVYKCGVHAMNLAVEISTARYERVHRRKPRGFTLWYFRMPDGWTFSQAGTYAAAKRAATAHARRRGLGPVARLQVWS